MLKDERLQKIRYLLNANKTVKVTELSKDLQVTPETIRKDLEELEMMGELKRVHGGAVLRKSNITETNFLVRETINQEEKKEIAKEAALLVQEGDCIALDVSTTNTEIIKELVLQFNCLSIITNSLTIATIASQNPSFSVYLPGGKLRNSELCLVGHSTISYIQQFHIDTFFMSASGVSIEKGFLDYGSDELEVKLAMLKNSMTTYAVMDHTKFHMTAMLKIGGLAIVEGIITDSKLEFSLKKQFEEQGVPIFQYQSNCTLQLESEH